MLALGIPGSGTAAILLGGLMVWGLNPGPLLFVEHKDFVWGTVESTSTRPTTLPRYIEAIVPHTKSLCSTNRSGPGLSPHTISPPSRIAAVPDPGMPSASIGRSAEVPEACAAVSGANTPSMRP